MTYDRPLAKANLMAREQVVHSVRKTLHSRVMVTQQKRNLDTGAVNWTDMTFKHVLLPIWTGTYTYKDNEYKILINGQTGKVNGDKPRDTVKTFAIIASVIATLLALGLIGLVVAVSMGWIQI